MSRPEDKKFNIFEIHLTNPSRIGELFEESTNFPFLFHPSVYVAKHKRNVYMYMKMHAAVKNSSLSIQWTLMCNKVMMLLFNEILIFQIQF